MKRYENAFLVSAVIVTHFSIFNLLSCILERDIVAVLVLGGILGLWWLAFARLRKLRKGSFAFSWTLLLLVCVGLLSQLVRRAVFIAQNNGMEGCEGYGSPVAFLIGLSAEVFFFLVFWVIAAFGLPVILEKRGSKLSSE